MTQGRKEARPKPDSDAASQSVESILLATLLPNSLVWSSGRK